MPNMYARGILWGKMILELGDMCTARNDRNGYTAEIQFKTKGYFSGTYNAIQGRVRAGTQDMGEVTGKWSEVMEYTSKKVCLSGLVRLWGVGCRRLTAGGVDGQEARALRRAEGW